MTDKQEPTDWRAECENLLDVWRDSERPYDHRHYVSGTFRGVIKEIEAKLAAPPAQPADADAQDAARYRWLEQQCAVGAYRGIISREAIDAAIDAAMKGSP